MSKVDIRFFKNRSSATGLLRKLGVLPLQYDRYIEKLDDGTYGCKVSMAKKHLENKARWESRNTITSVSRRLILDGLTNKEVWGVISTVFNLDDSKKKYPAWFRGRMRREGVIPSDSRG